MEGISNDSDGLRRSVALAEEAVRSQIARELHDDLSQRLAALLIHIQLLDDAVIAGTPLDRSSVQELGSQLNGIAEDVHGLTRQLHPTVVDSLGLTAALKDECSRRSRAGRIPVGLDVQLAGGDPAGATALALFRIAQEALSNALKHSRATRVDLELVESRGALRLTVRDNGCGIQGSEQGSYAPVGMTSMRERAELAGGALRVDSRGSLGTCVRATIPLRAAQV